MAKQFEALYTGPALAEQYARFRPTYSPAMFDFMLNYYEEGKGPCCNRDLAIDVGCGSGQATLPLANYFRNVIGCDISKDQLRHAPKGIQGVSFKECASEDLDFLEAQSVDMITTGAAFHWFDAALFFKEVARVLKPGGVLVVFGYGWPETDITEMNDLQQQHRSLMKKSDVVDFTRPRGSANYMQIYETYTLPFPEWQIVTKRSEFDIRREMTAADLVGYYRSEHVWWLHLEDNPGSDHLEILQRKMETILGDENSKMDVTFPVTLIIGRNPA